MAKGREVGAGELHGVNSVSFIDFDAENLAYYQGIFDVLAAGKTSDAEVVGAINEYVASRYVSRGYATTSESPRRTLEEGSGLSGYLCLAMAAVARAGGYDVRVVQVAADAPDGSVHTLVEVFYGGQWHAYDPAYGRSVPAAVGGVASYEELRRNPGLVARAEFRDVHRVGWKTDELPGLYTSGIHHYYEFKPVELPEGSRQALRPSRSAPAAF
jgi:hypothetical protein